MRLEVLVAPRPTRMLSGRVLRLTQPTSFWGGISPADGRLTDPRCRQFGESVRGRVLMIQELRGSSSGSSVLLELIYQGLAPSAILLAVPDGILALGALVACEMQWPSPGIFRLPAQEQLAVSDEAHWSIAADGSVKTERILP